MVSKCPMKRDVCHKHSIGECKYAVLFHDTTLSFTPFGKLQVSFFSFLKRK